MELSLLPYLIQLLISIQCIVIYVVNLTSLGHEELEIPFISIETVRGVRTKSLSKRSKQLGNA